ncbi:hypothetical protein BX600DRAFT_391178 [Xylariales sp. PMI_506]|nr:hypothetical protein BX600DRAFT_391178 [Xylariales sp. PMI_506]
MSSKPVIAVVTGANKGIGFAIVRNLAIAYPSSPLHSGPLLIYLTARSEERGREAVERLQNDPQIKEAGVLAVDGGDTSITFHSLDISDRNSVYQFRDFLKREHSGGIDILVNNAGIFMNGHDDNIVKELLATNYYGSLAMMQEILPLIRPGGRLVNVCSEDGTLGLYPDLLKQAFISASQTSVDACSALMAKFADDTKAGNKSQEGWPPHAYAVSKAGEIAVTKAIAMQEEKTGSKRNVLINACCPGFVNTDMTRGHGVKTADEGAKTPVLLALGDIGGSLGEFWQNEKIIEW